MNCLYRIYHFLFRYPNEVNKKNILVNKLISTVNGRKYAKYCNTYKCEECHTHDNPYTICMCSRYQLYDSLLHGSEYNKNKIIEYLMDDLICTMAIMNDQEYNDWDDDYLREICEEALLYIELQPPRFSL
jgi:hypothetical protein